MECGCFLEFATTYEVSGPPNVKRLKVSISSSSQYAQVLLGYVVAWVVQFCSYDYATSYVQLSRVTVEAINVGDVKHTVF